MKEWFLTFLMIVAVAKTGRYIAIALSVAYYQS